MKAKIKRLHSPDIPDLKLYKPEEEDLFGFLLQIFVGPENTDGEESFDMTVCTPKWLDAQCTKDGYVLGRHHLVVRVWDHNKLIDFLKKEIESIEGDTWQSIAEKIGRLASWEFEDYKHGN